MTALSSEMTGVSDKIGDATDTAADAPTSLFAGIKRILQWFGNTWTEVRAAKVDLIDTNIGSTKDTGGTNSAGSLMAKSNSILDKVMKLPIVKEYGVSVSTKRDVAINGGINTYKIASYGTSLLVSKDATCTIVLRIGIKNISSTSTSRDTCITQLRLCSSDKTFANITEAFTMPTINPNGTYEYTIQGPSPHNFVVEDFNLQLYMTFASNESRIQIYRIEVEAENLISIELK